LKTAPKKSDYPYLNKFGGYIQRWKDLGPLNWALFDQLNCVKLSQMKNYPFGKQDDNTFG